jgi:hypothetical protein
LRYFGGAVAFGFAAMWIMASLAAALVCLSALLVGYCVVFVAQRTWAELVRSSRAGTSAARSTGKPAAEGLPLWAHALNSDLGHVYEPSATNSALAREVEYGWPLVDDTAVTASEPLH